MKALEAALEALTNPSTIMVQHAIQLIKEELKKEKCFCENIQRCTMFDKCMRHEKE